MRIRTLLLCSALLPVSWGCSAQKNLSPFPAGDKPLLEQIKEPEMGEIIMQLSDELASCSGLSQFGLQNQRPPLVLVWLSAENEDGQQQLSSMVTKPLLASGKVLLALPRNALASLNLPPDRDAAARLKTESGADFLLLCTFSGTDNQVVQYELLSLDTAEVVFNKAIIINKIKT